MRRANFLLNSAFQYFANPPLIFSVRWRCQRSINTLRTLQILHPRSMCQRFKMLLLTWHNRLCKEPRATKLEIGRCQTITTLAIYRIRLHCCRAHSWNYWKKHRRLSLHSVPVLCKRLLQEWRRLPIQARFEIGYFIIDTQSAGRIFTCCSRQSLTKNTLGQEQGNGKPSGAETRWKND